MIRQATAPTRHAPAPARRLVPLFRTRLAFIGLLLAASALAVDPPFSFSSPPDPGLAVRACRFVMSLLGGRRQPHAILALEKAGIRLTDFLGQGGMGQAWLGRGRDSRGRDVYVIVKEALTEDRPERTARNVEALRNEYAMLRRVYPDRVRLIEGAGHSAVLVMELFPRAPGEPWAPAPTLYDRLHGGNRDPRLAMGPARDPAAIRDISFQLIDALEAIHSAGIIHGDLKPSNILVQTRPDGSHDVRIIDFGLAMETGSDANGSFGTPGYMGREAFEGRTVTAERDVRAMQRILEEIYLQDEYATMFDQSNPSTGTLRPSSARKLGIARSMGDRSVWWEPGRTYDDVPGRIPPAVAWALRSQAVRTVPELRSLLREAHQARSMDAFLDGYAKRWVQAYRDGDRTQREDLTLELLWARGHGPALFRRLPLDLQRAVVHQTLDLRDWQARNPQNFTPVGRHPDFPADAFLRDVGVNR